MNTEKNIRTMNGLDHITQTFTALREAGRAALMPYFTLGYPTAAEFAGG